MNSKDAKKYALDSNYRKRELAMFCRQYPEWQKKMQLIADLQRSSDVCISNKSKCISDAVGTAVCKRDKLYDKIRLVENTAKDSSGDMWESILLGVTKGLSFEQLKAKGILFYEKDAYYERRAKFFWLLDKRLEGE